MGSYSYGCLVMSYHGSYLLGLFLINIVVNFKKCIFKKKVYCLICMTVLTIFYSSVVTSGFLFLNKFLRKLFFFLGFWTVKGSIRVLDEWYVSYGRLVDATNGQNVLKNELHYIFFPTQNNKKLILTIPTK